MLLHRWQPLQQHIMGVLCYQLKNGNTFMRKNAVKPRIMKFLEVPLLLSLAR